MFLQVGSSQKPGEGPDTTILCFCLWAARIWKKKIIKEILTMNTGGTKTWIVFVLAVDENPNHICSPVHLILLPAVVLLKQ